MWRLTLFLSIALVVSVKGDVEEDSPEERRLAPRGPDPMCLEEPRVSDCRAAIPAWFFNQTSEQCESYIWGGCEESRNNFQTKPACIKKCAERVCSLPVEVGPCRAAIPQWFFDVTDRTCKQFAYGGCDGNENRFANSRDCELACGASGLECEMGVEFYTVSRGTVSQGWREKEWFILSCERKCRQLCRQDKPWGVCLAFSTEKFWNGCNCYMFNHPVSRHEARADARGVIKNRRCRSPPDATDED